MSSVSSSSNSSVSSIIEMFGLFEISSADVAESTDVGNQANDTTSLLGSREGSEIYYDASETNDEIDLLPSQAEVTNSRSLSSSLASLTNTDRPLPQYYIRTAVIIQSRHNDQNVDEHRDRANEYYVTDWLIRTKSQIV